MARVAGRRHAAGRAALPLVAGPRATGHALAGAHAWRRYVNAFATYDDTYGALGTTIAGLVWLWLTNLTLLAGVELDAALEYRREAMEGS